MIDHATLRGAIVFPTIMYNYNHFKLFVEYHVANSDVSILRAIAVKRENTVSAHHFSGRFLSPRVFSAYSSPFSKSRRFLTLINAFFAPSAQKGMGREKNQLRVASSKPYNGLN